MMTAKEDMFASKLIKTIVVFAISYFLMGFAMNNLSATDWTFEQRLLVTASIPVMMIILNSRKVAVILLEVIPLRLVLTYFLGVFFTGLIVTGIYNADEALDPRGGTVIFMYILGPILFIFVTEGSLDTEQ